MYPREMTRTFKIPTMVIPTILLFIYMSSTVINASTDIDVFANSVALQVSKYLIEQTKKITNYHKIKEDLEALNTKTTKKKLVGRDVIRKFKEDIEGIFSHKTEALKNIKKKAEEEKDKHEEDEEIKRFEYFNMNDIEKDDEVSLRIHPPFSPDVGVNMSNSFVQVPTNIFAYKPQILNTVKWTERLDETFKENYFNHSNETLLYQYYGDTSGLMRLYPGNTFKQEENKVDLYDCRRRIWYIQASASPKDVVIVIDMSGSMKGSNIGIARIASASLIETLSENDYFNVITINDKVNYVKPCAKHLIQATKLNKEAMKLALQNLGKPELIAQPDLGIEEAFKILNSGPGYNRTTASCNKAIMFISDGVEGENVAEEVFRKYNINRTVRAFAFFVGRTHVNVGRKALLRMACDNRGYFYPIETVGNVWDKVLDYLQVMSRPLNASRDNHPVTFTPMYLDVGGMGMIMSISMGVFDKNGLIGVTGTDITLRSLLEKLPVSTFGPLSYIFIVNNNGFLVMHPKLKEQKEYLVAPRNVFLEDLVRGILHNNSMELKRNMIDKEKNGAMPFPMYWLYDNDQKCAHIRATVFYEPIDKTEFSAGVVLADDEVSYVQYSDEAANDWLIYGVDALEIPTRDGDANGYHNVSIAQWEYCDKPYDNTTSKSVKNYYTAAELKAHLNDLKYDTIGDLPSNCNRDLLKKLLITAGIVSRRVDESWDSEELKKKLYDGVFVSTNGGYLKHFSHNQESPRYQKEFIKPPHFEMAAANPDATVSVSAPYVDSSHYVPGPRYFTVSAAVKVGDEKVMTAVSGVRIRSNFFSKILDDATSKEQNTYCAKNETHICALIDQNGYIISSNQGERYIGRFIGEISSTLIEKLAKIGIFKQIELENAQAECDQKESEKSGSNSIVTPFKFIYQGIAALFQTLSWIAIQYTSFLVSPLEGKSRENKVPIKVSCTMSMPFYIFQSERFRELHDDKHKEANCNSACNLIYYLNPVNESNLLFLIAKSTKQCRRVCTRLHENLRPTRNSTSIENRVCKTEQRYRRPPSACFNDVVQNEEKLVCGRAGDIKPSAWMVIILFSIYYVIKV